MTVLLAAAVTIGAPTAMTAYAPEDDIQLRVRWPQKPTVGFSL
jgi:hypothetical protein